MDFQSDNLFIQILMWLGIVLAAGFIGYFGRYLAMLIIERMRRKQQASTPATDATQETPVRPEITPEVARLEIKKQKAKAEKKKAKAGVKRAKKVQKD